MTDPAAAGLPGTKRVKLPPNPSSTRLAYEREFAAAALHIGAPHVAGHARARTGDAPAATSRPMAEVQVKSTTSGWLCEVCEEVLAAGEPRCNVYCQAGRCVRRE